MWHRLHQAETWAGIGPDDEVWDAVHDASGELESFQWSAHVGPTKYKGRAEVAVTEAPHHMKLLLSSTELTGSLIADMEGGDEPLLAVTLEVASQGNDGILVLSHHFRGDRPRTPHPGRRVRRLSQHPVRPRSGHPSPTSLVSSKSGFARVTRRLRANQDLLEFLVAASWAAPRNGIASRRYPPPDPTAPVARIRGWSAQRPPQVATSQAATPLSLPQQGGVPAARPARGVMNSTRPKLAPLGSAHAPSERRRRKAN